MPDGFRTFAVGEVLTAANVNDYLMEQVVTVFADATARDAAITSPQEGQISFLKDSDVLTYYSGSSWGEYIGSGDITAVNASTGLSGGGSSGAVSLSLDLNGLSAGTVSVANDSIAIIDADDSNNPKKETIADLATAMADGSTITATNGVLSSAGGVSLGLVIALS